MTYLRSGLFLALFCVLLVGCSSAPPPVAQAPSPTPEPTATATATPEPTATATVTPSPTATPEPTVTPSPEPTATATPAPSPTPAALTYVFPIQAARVEYGAYHHDYPAADIFCAIGSEFLAPVGGVIDFVSREDRWDPATNRPEHRGGLAVALIGDDGLRYYGSHLSLVADGIEPGVRVEAGQLLGLTGKSGNARGTPPHLHFGISRPTTPDDWAVRRGEFPPYEYLRAWERGESLSPASYLNQ